MTYVHFLEAAGITITIVVATIGAIIAVPAVITWIEERL